MEINPRLIKKKLKCFELYSTIKKKKKIVNSIDQVYKKDRVCRACSVDCSRDNIIIVPTSRIVIEPNPI